MGYAELIRNTERQLRQKALLVEEIQEAIFLEEKKASVVGAAFAEQLAAELSLTFKSRIQRMQALLRKEQDNYKRVAAALKNARIQEEYNL